MGTANNAFKGSDQEQACTANKAHKGMDWEQELPMMRKRDRIGNRHSQKCATGINSGTGAANNVFKGSDQELVLLIMQ